MSDRVVIHMDGKTQTSSSNMNKLNVIKPLQSITGTLSEVYLQSSSSIENNQQYMLLCA